MRKARAREMASERERERERRNGVEKLILKARLETTRGEGCGDSRSRLIKSALNERASWNPERRGSSVHNTSAVRKRPQRPPALASSLV
jgi:hypothetical protein